VVSDFDEQYEQYRGLLGKMEATHNLQEKYVLFKDLVALLG
jgi:hypothetical protein